MSINLNPYLSFRDSAREAMTFYQEVFGGDLTVTTFADSGHGDGPDANLVMHAQLQAPNDIILMGADTPAAMEPSQNGTISLSGDSTDELQGLWDKLSDGGVVLMALQQQEWGDKFGMFQDKFGINWMFNIAGDHS